MAQEGDFGTDVTFAPAPRNTDARLTHDCIDVLAGTGELRARIVPRRESVLEIEALRKVRMLGRSFFFFSPKCWWEKIY